MLKKSKGLERNLALREKKIKHSKKEIVSLKFWSLPKFGSDQ
jgi:hypothetical protein